MFKAIYPDRTIQKHRKEEIFKLKSLSIDFFWMKEEAGIFG